MRNADILPLPVTIVSLSILFRLYAIHEKRFHSTFVPQTFVKTESENFKEKLFNLANIFIGIFQEIFSNDCSFVGIVDTPILTSSKVKIGDFDSV